MANNQTGLRFDSFAALREANVAPTQEAVEAAEYIDRALRLGELGGRGNGYIGDMMSAERIKRALPVGSAKAAMSVVAGVMSDLERFGGGKPVSVHEYAGVAREAAKRLRASRR